MTNGLTSGMRGFETLCSQGLPSGRVSGAAQKRTGARRLLSTLSDARLMRREMFRLREWVQSTGTTAVVTAKVERESPANLDEFLQFNDESALLLLLALST